MIYLLDVNALLALGYAAHVHHSRAEAWVLDKSKESGFALATCAISELGFVRVASGPVAHATDVLTAKAALKQLKNNRVVRFIFVSDDLDAEQLPAWVQRSQQTTDGHLMALASTNKTQLVTFDTAIPGAELIP
jgi:predicted nucleic acid-binding protein